MAKKYKDPNWLYTQLLKGNRNKDIANELHCSIFTISKHVSNMINNLPLPKLVELVTNSTNPKQLISHKTKAYHLIAQATPFLPNTAYLRERIWYLSNNTTTPPSCKECTTPVKWDYTTQSFRLYCSTKCAGVNDEVQQKREQTNLTNHGVRHPASNVSINNQRKQTLLEKYGVTHQSQKHISQNSLDTLSNKPKMKKLICEFSTFEIADKLNVCQSAVSNNLRKLGVVSPRKTGSRHERELKTLIEQYTNEQIIINSRQIIPPNELDIYIPSLKLAFEFNGLYWHSELKGKGKYYHQNKTVSCNKKDIRLIQIFEHHWMMNKPLIQSRIQNLLKHNSRRIFARKCKIVKNISTIDSAKFLHQNHIQSKCGATYNIGLTFEGELVSLMTFGKSRYSKSYEYELIRFCSLLNTSVIGGASKLFKHFVTEYSPNTIISYSDKTWNTGNVYKKLGFTFSHTSKPNYYYFMDGHFETYSRVKFQKHKLPQQLDVFDPELTEWQNMVANGYNRYWDCGNDVWTWSNKDSLEESSLAGR